MDKYVEQSIEARKMSFINSYELTDAYQKKVDELFKRIEEFGENCNNTIDFETKFASSSLNQEYTDLFKDIATNCKPIIPTLTDGNSENDKDYLKKEIVSDAEYIAKDLTMPLRRKAREQFDKKCVIHLLEKSNKLVIP